MLYHPPSGLDVAIESLVTTITHPASLPTSSFCSCCLQRFNGFQGFAISFRPCPTLTFTFSLLTNVYMAQIWGLHMVYENLLHEHHQDFRGMRGEEVWHLNSVYSWKAVRKHDIRLLTPPFPNPAVRRVFHKQTKNESVNNVPTLVRDTFSI
jgi:hypothetical protein